MANAFLPIHLYMTSVCRSSRIYERQITILLRTVQKKPFHSKCREKAQKFRDQKCQINDATEQGAFSVQQGVPSRKI